MQALKTCFYASRKYAGPLKIQSPRQHIEAIEAEIWQCFYTLLQVHIAIAIRSNRDLKILVNFYLQQKHFP